MTCHGNHLKVRVEQTTFFVGAEKFPVLIERCVCLACHTVFTPPERRAANAKRLRRALVKATPAPGPLTVFRDELAAHLAGR